MLTRVPNLTQSSKLTQGLGHVSTFGNWVNGYLRLKDVSKVVLSILRVEPCSATLLTHFNECIFAYPL